MADSCVEFGDLFQPTGDPPRPGLLLLNRWIEPILPPTCLFFGITKVMRRLMQKTIQGNGTTREKLVDMKIWLDEVRPVQTISRLTARDLANQRDFYRIGLPVALPIFSLSLTTPSSSCSRASSNISISLSRSFTLVSTSKSKQNLLISRNECTS